MPNNRKTSPKVAKDASKLLKNRNSSARVKRVAGSDLSQAAPKRKR